MRNSREGEFSYQASFSVLFTSVPLDRQGCFEIEDLVSVADWRLLVPSSDMYAITAFHEGAGLFVKWFAPCAAEYGKVAARAIRELSQLELNTPVLPPIIVKIGKYGILVGFELGSQATTARFGEIYNQQEQELITATVENHGLLPLHEGDRIETVLVGEAPFSVDPLNDSTYSIFKYVNRGN